MKREFVYPFRGAGPLPRWHGVLLTSNTLLCGHSLADMELQKVQRATVIPQPACSNCQRRIDEIAQGGRVSR